MTLSPLQIGHKAIEKVMGVALETLRPRAKCFEFSFRFPKAIGTLSYDLLVEWDGKDKSLSFNVALSHMVFSPWVEEQKLYTFFSHLTTSMRPFLDLPQSIQECCFMIPVVMNADKKLAPAFAAMIGYQKMEERELEALIQKLMSNSTRSLFCSRVVLDALCQGILLEKSQQLRSIWIESERYKMILPKKLDEGEELPTMEEDPLLFN